MLANIRFNLYNNSTATGTPLFTDTESVFADGANSKQYTTTAAGTFYWVETYNGDSNNNAVTSDPAAELVEVDKYTPLVFSTTEPGTSSPIGSSTSAGVGVTGYFPTGTVTFNLYNNSGGTGTPLFTDTETLDNGTIGSKNFTPSTVGTYYWYVTYNGDSNNYSETVASSPPITITQAIARIETEAQPPEAQLGTVIDDMAFVTGHNPTGTVTFELFSNSTASGDPLFVDTEMLSGGVATSQGFIPTSTGTYYWVATYNGDTNNTSAPSPSNGETVTVGEGGAT